MKKQITIAIIFLLFTSNVLADGIMTNTNQNVYSIRNISRNASTQIDAAHSNPAGLIKLKDGFHFSLTNLVMQQEYSISNTSGNLESGSRIFNGKGNSPIIPSLQAAYKKEKWVFSLNLATSRNKKASFKNGLPQFESAVALLPTTITAIGNQLPPTSGINLSAKGYDINQFFKNTSVINGIQLGCTYEANKIISLYGGVRFSFIKNTNNGYLRNLKVGITSSGLQNIGLPIPDNDGTLTNPESFLSYAILSAQSVGDSNTAQSLNILRLATTEDGAVIKNKQSGNGIAPIIGINLNYEKLNIGMKYEFKAAINVENQTSIDDIGLFSDGLSVPFDIPALFTLGASYQIDAKLSASIGYNHYFESAAQKENDKQKYIKGGTNEYSMGIEYKINDLFLVSAGGQLTRCSIDQQFHSDLNFILDSYTIGLGGLINVSDNLQINLGYSWTNCTNKEVENDAIFKMNNTYSQSRKTFAVGVNYSF